MFVFSRWILAAAMLRVAMGVCTTPDGVTVREGVLWVAEDGCNTCSCTSTGARCNNIITCNAENTLGNPGELICTDPNGVFHVGQTWTAVDGCNQCVCTTEGVNCTFHPCSNTGFSQPKMAGEPPEFMDCHYNGHWYRYLDHFLATDGCNTCICKIPGNFATFPLCTQTPCDILG